MRKAKSAKKSKSKKPWEKGYVPDAPDPTAMDDDSLLINDPVGVPLKRSTGTPKIYDSQLYLTAAQFARSTNIAIDTVSRRIRVQQIPAMTNAAGTPVYKLYDLIQRVAMCDDSGRIDPDMLPPVQRRAHYQSMNERIKMLTSTGELIPVAKLEARMANAMKIVTHFFDTFPDVAERDYGMNSAQIQRLEKQLDLLRTDLYNSLIAGLEDDEVSTVDNERLENVQKGGVVSA